MWQMSCVAALAGQTRACVLTAAIVLTFVACGMCSRTCECDTPQVRAALTDFFVATGGARWRNASGWTTRDPVCSWYGVSCDGAKVTKIELKANFLEGTLPAGLASIVIEELELSENSLSGTLPPQWGNMTALKSLRLSNNQLNSSLPPEWRNLDSIVVMSLHDNSLTGPLAARVEQHEAA